jgi:hypothetical protein
MQLELKLNALELRSYRTLPDTFTNKYRILKYSEKKEERSV